mmetsp:Transcript_6381/g.15842  ORF Transcript_6381/g.15842 Transcript_6381/m.15842 type:complete len:129 (-) Transcript_6381:529-915(-)
MSADPKVAAEQYLEKHKLCQLLETLTAQLLVNKPDNPRDFIVKYLEGVKLSGTHSLLTDVDLKTMFGMLDITKRGQITCDQANNVMRTILGPAAEEHLVQSHETPYLSEDKFVEVVTQAMKATVPYRQ